MTGLSRQEIDARKSKGLCTCSVSCTGRIRDRQVYCEIDSMRPQKKPFSRFERNLKRSSEDAALIKSIDPIHMAPLTPPPKRAKLIRATFPHETPLEESQSLYILTHKEDRNMLGHDSWLEEASELDLPIIVVASNTEGQYIHQGLVIILAVKALSRVAVDFHTWEQLRGHVQNSTLSQICRDKDGKPLNTVLFVHWTTFKEPTNPTLEVIHGAIRILRHTHGASFRLYPNESEV